MLDRVDRFAAILRQFYDAQLRALGEPAGPLRVDAPDDEAIRLLWLPSFHPATAVRAFRRGAEYGLVASVLESAGGYAPGALARRESLPLGAGGWNDLRRLVGEPALWEESEQAHGLDGSRWILEWAVPGHYRVADHWSPEPVGRGARARALGVRLLELAGLEAQPLY